LKILFVAPKHSIHSARWIDWFAKKGLEYTWISLHPGDDIDGFDLKCDVVSVWEAIKIIKKHDGLVHIHYFGKSAFPILFGWRKALLITFWGSDFYRLKKLRLLRGLKFFSLIHKSVKFSSDANHIIEDLKKVKIDCRKLNFGMDTVKFSPLKNTKRENVFVSCRNFDPLYQTDMVIRAFQKSGVGRNGFQLKVFGVGTADQVAYIRQCCEEANRQLAGSVCFLGRQTQEQVLWLYRSSQFVVSASSRDGGLSAAVAEGMLCGCVPIISDAVDNLEWVTDQEGFSFSLNDEEDLIARFAEAASLAKTELRAKSLCSRTKIVNGNSIETEMIKCLELYKNMIQ